MKIARISAAASLMVATAASSASALPAVRAIAPAMPAATLVKYGHGPLPYGLYGSTKKKSHHGRSNGTGYHGRGSKTGGPAGGLPGRS